MPGPHAGGIATDDLTGRSGLGWRTWTRRVNLIWAVAEREPDRGQSDTSAIRFVHSDRDRRAKRTPAQRAQEGVSLVIWGDTVKRQFA